MENAKLKTLPVFLFTPLLLLISLRPFLIDFIYPLQELYYQHVIIFLALIFLFIKRKRPLKISYSIPVFLLLTASSLSLLVFDNILNSLSELYRFINYICVLILISQADHRQKHLVIKAIVIAAVVMSIYVIYQYYFGYPLTIRLLEGTPDDISLASSHVQDIIISKRAIGKFPTPNLLGSYLIMSFFLSMHLIVEVTKDKKWYLAPVSIIFALVLTKSIGAWLSLLACLCLLPFIFSRPSEKRKFILTLIIVLALAALTFIVISRGERIIQLNNPHNPITQRLHYWKTACGLIREHPFTGVSLGDFQLAALDYKAHPAMADVKFAHNIFLNYFAETGLLGFIGFILLSIVFLKKMTLKSKYIFLAGLSFLFHNLIDFSYFISQVGVFWWVILGLMESPNHNSGGSV